MFITGTAKYGPFVDGESDIDIVMTVEEAFIFIDTIEKAGDDRMKLEEDNSNLVNEYYPGISEYIVIAGKQRINIFAFEDPMYYDAWFYATNRMMPNVESRKEKVEWFQDLIQEYIRQKHCKEYIA